VKWPEVRQTDAMNNYMEKMGARNWRTKLKDTDRWWRSLEEVKAHIGPLYQSSSSSSSSSSSLSSSSTNPEDDSGTFYTI
jgi:hypothetical protein